MPAWLGLATCLVLEEILLSHRMIALHQFNLCFRTFPAFFQKGGNRGKRAWTGAKVVHASKEIDLTFFLLPERSAYSPSGDEAEQLLLAGLGRRLLSVLDTADHEEVILPFSLHSLRVAL